MMRSIIGWSMQLRLLLVAGAALLIVFGVTELRNLPVDVVPEFSRPYVEVQTEARGLSAAEVESMITVPLEADMLNGVPWLSEIRSKSIPGLSSIVMFFEPGTELLTARQMVQERLVGVHALPQVSKPPVMLQPLSSTSRLLEIGLNSEERSLIDLSVLARWTIVPRLMGVPGVANVSVFGQRKRQLQVQVDPKRLRAEGVALRQVIEATGNALWVSPLSFLDASTPGTGGWIETPNQRLGVQHVSPITTPGDLAKVSVEGTLLRLGELATVVEDHQPLIGDAVINDEPALMLVVDKFPWASTVDVTRDVEAALTALQHGLVGVEMDSTLFRPATYLELATDNLSRALWIGLALVVVALVGLTFSWRSALVSALAVVLSGLAAGAVLYLRDAPINMLVIAGMMVALGVLIDDAIIDVRNVARRLRERAGEGRSVAMIIFEAAQEARAPIVYALLILLLALTPLFFMEGVSGVFGREIAASYGLALLASMAVALTVTPALCMLLMREASTEGGSGPILDGLQAGFDRLLSGTLRVAGVPLLAVVGAAGAAMLVAGAFFQPASLDLVPEFRERDVVIDLDGAPGTSEVEMHRVASRLSRELRTIPGVRNVSANVGRAVLSDDVTDVDTSEIWVSLDRDGEYDAALAAIRAAVTGYPGFDIDVDTYLSEQIRDVSDTDDALVIRVYGENLETLRRKADEVKGLLARMEGVSNPRVQSASELPNLEIEVDLARAKNHGLKPGDVRRAATTLLSGIQVGSLFEEQKVFDVVVWSTPEVRRSVSDVEELLLETPGGGYIRLSDVAHVRIAAGPKVINREAVARHIDVSADVAGSSFAKVSAEIEGRIREIEFPLEYRAEVLGAAAARMANRERVAAFAMGAALGIFLLLQAAFGSWRLAFFVFLALPLTLLGGLLVATATGTFTSLGALLGLVAVFAVAVRNTMSLIKHYRHLEAEGSEPLSVELVRRGTADRLAPILTTAMVTALAFLPFALLGNVAGMEILHPMAMVVLGGLVSAALVNLMIMPALYLRFGAAEDSLDLMAEEERPRMIA